MTNLKEEVKKPSAGLFLIGCYLVLSCSIITPEENNAVVDIPDAVFEKILIDLEIDSDNEINQEVLREDAEEVTQLDLTQVNNNTKIRDLTGIEGFINLRKLVVAGHELESIDLSSNTELDTLYLQVNLLNSLDLSSNTKLMDVNVSLNELHLIEGLDHLNSLKKLDASWNLIERFEIASSSVEVLFLNNNELSDLDIRNAVSLSDLIATSNELEVINLSTNRSLSTLVLSDNLIQSIDLKENTELMYLYVSSNVLSALDVSNNQNLVDLRVQNNLNLQCIKVSSDQNILTVVKSDNQELETECN
jgi:hypothetical protein